MNAPKMSAKWQEKLTSFGLEQKDGRFVYPTESTATEVLCTLASDLSLIHI